MTALSRSAAPEILVTVLPHAAGMPLPSYATDRSAGMDLAAAVTEDLVIEPARTALVPTGLMIAVPDGFEAQVRPRSGLALEYGITVPNSPGTIDADYRGEVKVILHNLGSVPFIVSRGMRIAQLVVAPAVQASLKIVDKLPASERGEGGFGHTGT